MHGIRTCGQRMVGSDETTELWRLPCRFTFYNDLALAARLSLLITFAGLSLLTRLSALGSIVVRLNRNGKNVSSLFSFSFVVGIGNELINLMTNLTKPISYTKLNSWNSQGFTAWDHFVLSYFVGPCLVIGGLGLHLLALDRRLLGKHFSNSSLGRASCKEKSLWKIY